MVTLLNNISILISPAYGATRNRGRKRERNGPSYNSRDTK